MQFPFATLVVTLSVSIAVYAPIAHTSLLDADDVPIGTTVLFETDFGDFTIGLFDSVTPQTVANFVNYVEGTTVNGGSYDDGIFHRYLPGFVIQAGLAGLSGNSLFPVPTDPSVVNEPFVSNTVGTIAMAKVGGDPDSATSQFFFNLADNSANLDNQNGGFTAFGRVLSGLDTLLSGVAGLTPVNASAQLGSVFESLPLEDFNDGLIASNLVSYAVRTYTRGDYNDDGDVDADDIDLLFASLGNSGPLLDLDGDGGVADLADVDELVRVILSTEFGDANLDGSVDPQDVSLLVSNFGFTASSVAAIESALASGDTALAFELIGASVPEPATLALLGGGVAALAGRRHRSSHKWA